MKGPSFTSATGQLCKVLRGILSTNLQVLENVPLCPIIQASMLCIEINLHSFVPFPRGLLDVLEGVILQKIFARSARVFRPSDGEFSLRMVSTTQKMQQFCFKLMSTQS